MNITLIAAAILFVCLVGAALLGRRVRRYLPENHLSADSKDAVKLAMGLVATMTALVLGLLVSSAKGTYDTARSEVIQMAAKIAFLDRVLGLYGPQAADAFYEAIQRLSPRDDTQRALKTEAANLMVDLAQLRSLLIAQSIPSISIPMLIILVSWLVVIFLGFSVLAPPNATTTVALIASAFSVACAIFLILELDQPFGGLIRIPSQPMVNVLSHLAK